MKSCSVLALSAVALTLTACGGQSDEAPADVSNTDAVELVPVTGAADPAQAATFDLSRVAISTAALGAFPFVSVPAGYEAREEATMDLAAFPIWTGQAFQTVEGKVHMARSGTPDGKTYSRLEFQRAFDASVKALGGVQVASGDVPNPVVDALPQTLRSDMSLGIGSIYGNAVTTYVIRQADRTVWIHLVNDSSQGNWAVVEVPVTPAA